MKVTGTYSLKAPAERVWQALIEPETLAHCMPGCDKLERTGENQYEAILSVGIGAIKGTYTAKITLSDLVPPSSYKMVVDGTGTPGFIHGEGEIALSEQDGTTTVRLEGDAQVGGPVAMVGQRLMGTVNKTMMDRFFRCVGRSVK